MVHFITVGRKRDFIIIIYIIFNDSFKVNFDYYWLANPPCAHSFVANRNKLNPANRESVFLLIKTNLHTIVVRGIFI